LAHFNGLKAIQFAVVFYDQGAIYSIRNLWSSHSKTGSQNVWYLNVSGILMSGLGMTIQMPTVVLKTEAFFCI
jgi:hypothetical protein